MVSHRTIILDCGAGSTALGIFSRAGEQLCLHRTAVEIFPVGANGAERWLANTCAAIQALGARVKCSDPVCLVLPAQHALIKFIDLPPVGPAQRAQILEFAAEQNIPYALAEVAWASVVLDQSKGQGAALLAAAKLELLDPLCAAAESVGWEVSAILPAPLATLAAFRLAQPSQCESALVLHLGADGTTLLLVEPSRFTLRRLALGDGEIAESIEGAAPAAGLINYVHKLGPEITRSLLHFQRQHNWAKPARVYLTGPGAARAELVAALAAELSQPVERLTELGVVKLAADCDSAAMASSARWLTDVVGAAAAQLFLGHPTINLLPHRWRQLTRRRRRQPWLLAAAVLMVAAPVAPIWHASSLLNEAQRKIAAMERENKPLRNRQAQQKITLSRLAESQRQLEQLQVLSAQRAGWLNFLAELEGHFVRLEDVWLEKMQLLPSVGPEPLKIIIAGRLLDQAHPLATVSVGAMNRVQRLLQSIDRSPYVRVAVDGQHFDYHQPGVLKFDCVLILRSTHPL